MEVLKKFRKGLNMTQKLFAKSIGVSESLYIKIELGIRKPSRNFISKLKSKYPEINTNVFFLDKNCTKRAKQTVQSNLKNEILSYSQIEED
ncbi:MAG: helix-turn-helix transcriptional regulator [Clostridium sp.]|jgi:putative transcriptional regulator|nr:helix-turn-helix transcriptional regulator [Clostridium sp.]